MWRESLNIRLGITVAWLALAASLVFFARFDPELPTPISSAGAMETRPAPVAVQVVDRADAKASEDAG